MPTEADGLKTENTTAQAGNESGNSQPQLTPEWVRDYLKTADAKDPVKVELSAYVNKLIAAKHREAKLEQESAENQVAHYRSELERMKEQLEQVPTLEKTMKKVQQELAAERENAAKLKATLISDRQQLAINKAIGPRIVDDQVNNAVKLLMSETVYREGEGVFFVDGAPLFDDKGEPSESLAAWLKSNPSLVKTATAPGTGARGSQTIGTGAMTVEKAVSILQNVRDHSSDDVAAAEKALTEYAKMTT